LASIREQVRKDRREQILDAAALIVSEKGYFGFGIQELATRCGLTKAGLLHHFPSKEALVIEMLRDRDERDKASVTNTIELSFGGDAASPSLDKVRATFLAIVERNLQQPDLVRLFAVVRAEALNPGHPAHRHMATRDAAALKLFENMLMPHTSSALSVARQVQATMHGLELQWLQAGYGFDMLRESEEHFERILQRPC
jgi:AcrR family transcriptional regulator